MTKPISPTTPMLTMGAPGHPFDLPAELEHLRAEHPVVPMAYADGHQGWLVTSHELVRAVLADPRFSARRELAHAWTGTPQTPAARQPAPPGMFLSMDPPDHTRYRHLLTGQFTVRRMRQLTARIQQVAAEYLDAMERQGPPVDLVAAYAQPIPALVVSELLGVSGTDREEFQQHLSALMQIYDADPEAQKGAAAAMAALPGFMHKLIEAKRAHPADDLLGGLVAESDLTDEELGNIGFALLGAGFETTVNMISLGTFALLQHPDQLAALRAADQAGVNQAVEELLRYLSILPGTIRAALEDVELGGTLIRKGETVTVSIPMANRDSAKFSDPDFLDLHRSAGGHVAFGHGVHQCLGQQLARVEMQVAYPALFDRFPALRLAVAPEEVPLKKGSNPFYGVERLPVTWEAT